LDTADTGDGPKLSVDIDYEAPLEKVYTSLAKNWIRHYDSLDILQVMDGRGSRYNLPSWVPTWSGNSSGLLSRNEDYSASAGQRAQAIVSFDDLALHGHGITFDDISGVSNRYWGEIRDGENSFVSYSRGAREWAAMAKALETYPGGRSIQEAWAMTVTGNWAGQTYGISIKDALSVVHLCMASDNVEEDRFRKAISWSEDQFFTRMIEVCYNARFFVTKKGYMGVGPKCLEKGDSVFILRGLNSPLILRKVEEEGQRGAGSKTESRVVGVAYVHGIMMGEAYDEDLLEEVAII
jgi:hypothetical protein